MTIISISWESKRKYSQRNGIVQHDFIAAMCCNISKSYFASGGFVFISSRQTIGKSSRNLLKADKIEYNILLVYALFAEKLNLVSEKIIHR